MQLRGQYQINLDDEEYNNINRIDIISLEKDIENP